MTRSRSLPFVLAISLTGVALAACGDDHDTAKFASADDAHLRRAVEVLRIGDMGSLYIVGAFASGATSTECPTITTAGAVTTIAGGCTNDDGDRFAGQIVITNVTPVFSTNPAVDPSQPGTVEAIDFTVTGTDSNLALDGVVTVTPRDGNVANGGTLSGDLDATIDGLAAHSAMTYSCDSTDLCTMEADSWMGVDGVGEATVTGQFRFDDPPTGDITAHGADTLAIDVANSADDCITFSIDGGAARQLCEQQTSARRAPTGRRALADRLGLTAAQVR